MREVVFKNLTSVNSRKKDIFLQEVFEKDGVLARTERRCFYYIKDITHLENQDDLQKWLEVQNKAGNISKRQFYIYKEHSDSLGEDKLLCKILGTFYAIIDQCVYTIVFLHSFRVRFTKSTLAK
ncbi:MAG: hypothetical protein NC938_03825 [Candidatus Omnitrophica bacterium]|nr:hypothetical protein [Candidatus Omnitrophota bacterium]MCM8790810.1 hypothetical protein [Candidatus Omnitrophota bacterium]